MLVQSQNWGGGLFHSPICPEYSGPELQGMHHLLSEAHDMLQCVVKAPWRSSVVLWDIRGCSAALGCKGFFSSPQHFQETVPWGFVILAVVTEN